MMHALLGNKDGIVEREYPFVYARMMVFREIAEPPKMEVVLVKNEGIVPNVYDLPVKVQDGSVIGIYREGGK